MRERENLTSSSFESLWFTSFSKWNLSSLSCAASSNKASRWGRIIKMALRDSSTQEGSKPTECLQLTYISAGAESIQAQLVTS